MNYQRELDMLLAKLEKAGKFPGFCFTAAVRLQQLCAGIFK